MKPGIRALNAAFQKGPEAFKTEWQRFRTVARAKHGAPFQAPASERRPIRGMRARKRRQRNKAEKLRAQLHARIETIILNALLKPTSSVLLTPR